MKPLIIAFFILYSFSVYSQNEYPRIQKFDVNDKIIKGRIDKYPITIYLSFSDFSYYSALSYSVSGWYYYDKIKTKIPLYGMFYYNDLTLYNISDSIKSEQLLRFDEFVRNRWDEKEYYENLKGFNEKFVFRDSSSFWTDGKQNLPVTIYSKDLSIIKSQEFLMLDEDSFFNLHNLGNGIENIEIIASLNHKIIMTFEYSSNPGHIMGRCGAGLEKGFIFIEFTESQKLVEYGIYEYESCFDNISLEERKEISKNIIEYECYDYNNSKAYTLRLDLKEISIEKL